jgi:threonine dehydratase
VCGNAISPFIFARVPEKWFNLESGLVHDGRLTRFMALISDRPGGLAVLCRVTAAAGASIKDIAHDRAFSEPDVP